MSKAWEAVVNTCVDNLVNQYAASDWNRAKEVVEGLDIDRMIAVAIEAMEAHGWRLVPVEATPAMKSASSRISHTRDGEIYAAMVGAAPRVTEQAP